MSPLRIYNNSNVPMQSSSYGNNFNNRYNGNRTGPNPSQLRNFRLERINKQFWNRLDQVYKQQHYAHLSALVSGSVGETPVFDFSNFKPAQRVWYLNAFIKSVHSLLGNDPHHILRSTSNVEEFERNVTAALDSDYLLREKFSYEDRSHALAYKTLIKIKYGKFEFSLKIRICSRQKGNGILAIGSNFRDLARTWQQTVFDMDRAFMARHPRHQYTNRPFKDQCHRCSSAGDNLALFTLLLDFEVARRPFDGDHYRDIPVVVCMPVLVRQMSWNLQVGQTWQWSMASLVTGRRRREAAMDIVAQWRKPRFKTPPRNFDELEELIMEDVFRFYDLEKN